MNRMVTILLLNLVMPVFSYAMPANLNCKLYGQHGSAQMHSQEGKTRTYLNFSHPIAWYPDLLSFELVYSSGYKLDEPLTLVGNAIASNGIPQTVQITLAAPLVGDSTSYGTVRAGDLRGDWYSTIGKYKTYEIQCYNF